MLYAYSAGHSECQNMQFDRVLKCLYGESLAKANLTETVISVLTFVWLCRLFAVRENEHEIIGRVASKVRRKE